MLTKPSAGRRIDCILAIIAKQRDAIALDHATITVRTWIVVDTDPQERHGTDVVANGNFQRIFAKHHVLSWNTELGGCLGRIASDVPRNRTLVLPLSFKGLAHEHSKNRAPMVSAAGCSASMLGKSLPKGAF
jgi:hypothetical protein